MSEIGREGCGESHWSQRLRFMGSPCHLGKLWHGEVKWVAQGYTVANGRDPAWVLLCHATVNLGLKTLHPQRVLAILEAGWHI